MLQLNGKDLQDLPIEERKAKLEELLKKPPGVIRYSVSFTKDIPELLDRAQTLGLEGLIGKRAGSRYEAGKRTGAWIKVKLHLEQEFVIGGYTEPEGSRKYFGALLVGFYEGKKLKFAGRVGTGFSDKLLRSLYSELQKNRVDTCPFFNRPGSWPESLGPRFDRCRNETLSLGQAGDFWGIGRTRMRMRWFERMRGKRIELRAERQISPLTIFKDQGLTVSSKVPSLRIRGLPS